MKIRDYIEDNYGMSTHAENAWAKKYSVMQESIKGAGLDVFRNINDIVKDPKYLDVITNAASVVVENANQYVQDDLDRINASLVNVKNCIMNEAVAGTIGDISPIIINSFGIQERALICPHLTRAVKTIVAKKDSFKLTERIPFMVDLTGNRHNFIDAFTPDENGNTFGITIEDVVVDGFLVPSQDINLYEANGTSTDPDYRVAVDSDNRFGFNSELTTVAVSASPAEAGKTWTWKSSATDPATAPTITFSNNSVRCPELENGTFRVNVSWNEYDSANNYEKYVRSAAIMGQFDLGRGKLVAISSTNNLVTSVKFKLVLSPETHKKALGVGYTITHQDVYIPVGAHYEFEMSEEFKDAAETYYDQDAMAVMTDLMGREIEQVKDIDVLNKYKKFANNAVIKTVFNCKPDTAFAQGAEEFIRREFCPFMEKVATILKNKVRIPNCHFRVVGNPLDIRVAAAAGTEYIYKRNEQFAGEICLDYEFSVTSDIHKIFYLSSERVPVGKVWMFLIPNSTEDGIITFNHYEYATYVSNQYRSSKGSALPTVMISNRYLTHAYYPVMAEIAIVNNLDYDPNAPATGTGLSDAIYAKVQYFNA